MRMVIWRGMVLLRSWQATVKDVAVQLPLACLLLPYDDVLALIDDLVAGQLPLVLLCHCRRYETHHHHSAAAAQHDAQHSGDGATDQATFVTLGRCWTFRETLIILLILERVVWSYRHDVLPHKSCVNGNPTLAEIRFLHGGYIRTMTRVAS